MSCPTQSETEQLLHLAGLGDGRARSTLLGRHRARLRKLIAFRIDKRLAPRVDASDVVQEAMSVAHRRLPEFLNDPGRPFYPWLRGIALDRLVDIYRHHLLAVKRSVLREERLGAVAKNESEYEPLTQLISNGPSPDAGLMRSELVARVHCGLQQLSASDCEILTLRYLEQLSAEQIAEALKISKSAVTSRHLRAVQRLRVVLHRGMDGQVASW